MSPHEKLRTHGKCFKCNERVAVTQRGDLLLVVEAHAPCSGAGALAVTIDPRVVAAAIRLKDGRVFSLPIPAIHAHVRDHILELGLWLEVRSADWGFVTDDNGEFLTREDAWARIQESRQPLKPGRVCSATKRAIPDNELIGSVLTSEDLW